MVLDNLSIALISYAVLVIGTTVFFWAKGDDNDDF